MKNLLILVAILGLNAIKINAQHTEKRNVGTYDGIHVAGSYEVKLVSGSEGTIELKGDPDDLDKIETEVRKGTLLIKQQEKSWFGNWDSGTVYITIPVEKINKVILSGSGEIHSKVPLEGDHFKTILSGSGEISLNLEVTAVNGTVTGSGEITLIGKANKVNFTVTGSGDIDAGDIKADTGEAKITGSGDIIMNTSENLNASITGSGDIICKGKPEKQITKVTGSGDIIIRD
jgi:hypothetical protein